MNQPSKHSSRGPDVKFDKFNPLVNSAEMWFQRFTQWLQLQDIDMKKWASYLSMYIEDQQVSQQLSSIICTNIDDSEAVTNHWLEVSLLFLQTYKISDAEADSKKTRLPQVRKQVDEDPTSFILRFERCWNSAYQTFTEQTNLSEKIRIFLGAIEDDIIDKYHDVSLSRPPTKWSEFTSIIVSLYARRTRLLMNDAIVNSILRTRIEDNLRINQVFSTTHLRTSVSTSSYAAVPMNQQYLLVDPFITPPIQSSTMLQFLPMVIEREKQAGLSITHPRPHSGQSTAASAAAPTLSQLAMRPLSTVNPTSDLIDPLHPQKRQKMRHQHSSAAAQSPSSQQQNNPRNRPPAPAAAAASSPSVATTQRTKSSTARSAFVHIPALVLTDEIIAARAATPRGNGPCSDCGGAHHLSTCSRQPGHAFSNPKAFPYANTGPPPPRAANSSTGGTTVKKPVMLLHTDGHHITIPITIQGLTGIDNIVDSGSDENHMTYQQLIALPHPPTIHQFHDRHVFVNADGTPLSTRGYCFLFVEFTDILRQCKYNVEMKLTITDQLAIPIVWGLTGMRNIIDSINYNNYHVYFSSKLTPLSLTSSSSSSSSSSTMTNQSSSVRSNIGYHVLSGITIQPDESRLVQCILHPIQLDSSVSSTFHIRSIPIFNRHHEHLNFSFDDQHHSSSSNQIHNRSSVFVTNHSSRPIHLRPNRKIGSVTRSFDTDPTYIIRPDITVNRLHLIHSLLHIPRVSFTGSIDSLDKPVVNDTFDINPSLTPEEQRKVLNILTQNKLAFASKSSAGVPSIAHKVQHTIHVGNAAPIKQAPYRATPANNRIIKEKVDSLLKSGVIRESSSPWASPVILVAKKDGEPRMCVDYRRLNSCVVKDGMPLPRVDDSLHSLRDAVHLSIIDLKEAYHHIPLHPDSVPLSAFVTQEGLYEWNVMTFGHTNAPGTFQRYINTIFRDLLNKGVIAYFDDIVVYTNGTLDEHIHALDVVLKRLSQHGLTAKMSKCHFAYNELKFLGHIISNGTIRPDPEKVRGISEFPVPTSVEQLRSFLGLSNYYRKFIKDFALIARPLYRLTRRGVDWQWGDAEQQAFTQLKQQLLSPNCLHSPNYDLPFVLQTDASGKGFGAVLTQIFDGVEHPVSFISTQLTKGQMNYSATELECAAVIWAIKEFEYLLRDKRFTVVTDHKASEWLPTKNSPNKRIMRWFMFLDGIVFDVKHRAGTANANADALSRCPVPSPPDTRQGGKELDDILDDDNDHVVSPIFVISSSNHAGIFARKKRSVLSKVAAQSASSSSSAAPSSSSSSSSIPNPSIHRVHPIAHTSNDKSTYHAFTVEDTDQRSELIASQQHDKQLRPLITYLETKSVPASFSANERAALVRNSSKFIINPDDNGLYYTGTPSHQLFMGTFSYNQRLVIPHDYHLAILEIFHTSAFGGHLGITRTYRKIASRYYWTSLWNDTANYIKQCPQCQAEKIRRRTPAVAFQKINDPDYPFQIVSMDYIGPLTQSADFKYVLVIVDLFTHWAITVPCINADTTSTALIFINEVFTKFGSPEILLSDQGQHFVSAVLDVVWRTLHIDKRQTTAFHPQTNGVVERYNATLKAALRCLCSDHPSDWVTMLQSATFAYNTSPHEITGLTPAMMNYGRELRLPGTIVTPDFVESAGNNPRFEYFNDLLKSLQIAHNHMKLQLATDRNVKSVQDKITRKVILNVGDRVLVSLPPGKMAAWTDNSHLKSAAASSGKPTSKKALNRPYNGPYTVLKVFDGGQLYEIQPTGFLNASTEVMNIDRLKYIPTRKVESDTAVGLSTAAAAASSSPAAAAASSSSSSSSPSLVLPSTVRPSQSVPTTIVAPRILPVPSADSMDVDPPSAAAADSSSSQPVDAESYDDVEDSVPADDADSTAALPSASLLSRRSSFASRKRKSNDTAAASSSAAPTRVSTRERHSAMPSLNEHILTAAAPFAHIRQYSQPTRK